jgi:hypothetical protein
VLGYGQGAFRFAGRIDPDSIGHSWSSPAIADSHRPELVGDNRYILVGRSREPLHHQDSHYSLAAGGDSQYSGYPTNLRQTARPQAGAKGGC